MKYIDQLELAGKRVLLRVDFNVPLDKGGEVTDDTRIRRALPTINYALEKGAALLIASHLGRPKGQRLAQYSLKPVAKRLGEFLDREVPLLPDCVGPEVEAAVKDMVPGQVLMLENLRYHSEEEKNDQGFARRLAALAQVYVNDAFAVCHRANASVVAVTRFFQEKAAGFLLKDEMEYFERALKNPARPLVAIVGGAKVSTKLGVLTSLMSKVDKVIIGGAMANTFLKALYGQVGASLVEEDLLPQAGSIMDQARQRGVKLYLPVDCVAADKMDASAQTRIVPVQEVPEGWMILDVGPATTTLFGEALEGAGTIVWNGPMGAFELEPFSQGTFSLAKKVASCGALSIIGGGDTDLAVHKAGCAPDMSYISTGGGAFLELLEGKTLPGIAALE